MRGAWLPRLVCRSLSEPCTGDSCRQLLIISRHWYHQALASTTLQQVRKQVCCTSAESEPASLSGPVRAGRCCAVWSPAAVQQQPQVRHMTSCLPLAQELEY